MKPYIIYCQNQRCGSGSTTFGRIRIHVKMRWIRNAGQNIYVKNLFQVELNKKKEILLQLKWLRLGINGYVWLNFFIIFINFCPSILNTRCTYIMGWSCFCLNFASNEWVGFLPSSGRKLRNWKRPVHSSVGWGKQNMRKQNQ